MNLEKEVFDIALKDIMPNRFQPREVFDENALNELAASIKEHGVIQPIIVRKVGDKYELIAGERRFRASQLAGKETIPALVRDIDDKEAAKIALLENLQRKDLTAIEEARTYQTILKLDNITQDELAMDLGKSQSAIANKLRLLNLDESVQTALLNEKISERHARSLLNVADPAKQRELLEKVILNRMTVRQLDEEIAKLTGKQIATEEQTEEKEPKQEEAKIDDLINNEVNNLFTEASTQQPNNTFVNPSDFVMPKEEQQAPVNNIFANLRINPSEEEQKQNDTFVSPTSEEKEPKQEETYPNILGSIPVQNTPTQEQLNTGIYDLRFAINNVRQAVQNTEKFGFKIETQEFDFDNVYQIVIKIDKNK